jgi:hypothetical protein
MIPNKSNSAIACASRAVRSVKAQGALPVGRSADNRSQLAAINPFAGGWNRDPVCPSRLRDFSLT